MRGGRALLEAEGRGYDDNGGGAAASSPRSGGDSEAGVGGGRSSRLSFYRAPPSPSSTSGRSSRGSREWVSRLHSLAPPPSVSSYPVVQAAPLRCAFCRLSLGLGPKSRGWRRRGWDVSENPTGGDGGRGGPCALSSGGGGSSS